MHSYPRSNCLGVEPYNSFYFLKFGSTLLTKNHMGNQQGAKALETIGVRKWSERSARVRALSAGTLGALHVTSPALTLSHLC